MSTNIIDEVMRLPATEFTGPNDPRLGVIINYWRAWRMKAEQGKRAERSEFADDEIAQIVVEDREISKPKAFRRA